MLNEALNNLKQTKLVAETEVAGDPRTRPGREMVRRQAQVALPKLEKEFRNQLKKVGFPIFVTGAQTDEFVELVKIATDEVIVVDWQKATGVVRDAVRVTIGRNEEFGVSGFSALVRECKNLAAAVGLDSMASPTYDGGVFVTSPEALNKLVDKYILTLGSEFIVPVIEAAAVKEALTMDCTNPVIPVLVTNLPADVALAITPRIFSGKAAKVNVVESPTDNDVDELLAKVQKSVKEN